MLYWGNNPGNKHMFKVTTETWRCSDVFIVNFEHTSYFLLVLLLQTLHNWMFAGNTPLITWPAQISPHLHLYFPAHLEGLHYSRETLFEIMVLSLYSLPLLLKASGKLASVSGLYFAKLITCIAGQTLSTTLM